jgi:histidinol-phosphate aminotransferase
VDRLVIADDLLREELAGLAPYAIPSVPDVRAKLDANESPCPLPPRVAGALGAHLARVAVHRYPDGHARALRALVAADAGADPTQVVFGNGSDELITLLYDTFSRPRPGKARPAVAYPVPSFIVYRIAALGRGVEPVEIPLGDDFTLDLDLVSRTLERERPNLLLLALPNNPTGTLWPLDGVAALAARHPDVLVVSDEAYAAYSGETLLGRLADLPNLVVMRTLSKIGMAALRVGYLVAHPAVAAAIEKIRSPYNVGALNQAAAVFLLERHRDVLDAAVRDVVAERERVVAALGRVTGLEVFPTRANLVLVRVGTPGDGRASALWGELARQGILVRNFDRPGPLSGCLRLTIGTREENDLLLRALLV